MGDCKRQNDSVDQGKKDDWCRNYVEYGCVYHKDSLFVVVMLGKRICLSFTPTRYSLGPNGGIVTSLNLFATRFDQVRSFVQICLICFKQLPPQCRKSKCQVVKDFLVYLESYLSLSVCVFFKHSYCWNSHSTQFVQVEIILWFSVY